MSERADHTTNQESTDGSDVGPNPDVPLCLTVSHGGMGVDGVPYTSFDYAPSVPVTIDETDTGRPDVRQA